MTALLQHWSGCDAIDSTDAPDHYLNGIPFDSNSCVSIDSVSAISYYHQGIPFTANGRLAVVIDGTYDYSGSGSASFDSAGRLMVLLGNTRTDQGHGVGYNARSVLFTERVAYEMTKPLTTNDWRTNGAGVVEVVQDGDFIKFTPAASKIECWTGYKSGLIIGETYRVEIEIGDSTTSSLTALVKNDLNQNQNPGGDVLTANTSGADNAFTFVANDTIFQQNIQTGTTGYVECGVMRYFGPLSV
jgi:hypothetical protein